MLLHLQPRPGTDLALANGLLHLVVRGGHVDEEYVAARTTGFPAVKGRELVDNLVVDGPEA